MKRAFFLISFLALSLFSAAQNYSFTHSVDISTLNVSDQGVTATFSNPVRVNPEYNYITFNETAGYVQVVTEKGTTYYTENNLYQTGQTFSAHSIDSKVIINPTWINRIYNNKSETYLIHDDLRYSTKSSNTGLRKMGQN